MLRWDELTAKEKSRIIIVESGIIVARLASGKLENQKDISLWVTKIWNELTTMSPKDIRFGEKRQGLIRALKAEIMWKMPNSSFSPRALGRT